MEQLTIYNGCPYQPAALRGAAESLGYLVWMKMPEGHWGNDGLLALLERDLSHETDPYCIALERSKREVYRTIEALQRHGITHVRLGASWAEGVTPGGWHWIGWYTKTFHEAGLVVLPNINYTPQVFAEARLEAERGEAAGDPDRQQFLKKLGPSTNIPPLPLTGLAEFTDQFLTANGQYVGEVIELWNEPDIETDWRSELDPAYERYVEMFAAAASVVRRHGRKVLMGGPAFYRPEWWRTVGRLGLFDHVDILGIHGLRGTWSDTKKRPPWSERIKTVTSITREFTDQKIPVWITEAGFTTVDLEDRVSSETLEEIQVAIFADLLLTIADGHTDRVYWYTWHDLVHESVRFHTTGWEDILQYYYGDTNEAGGEKLLGRLLIEGGAAAVLKYAEVHRLWEVKDTIINRGDPGAWSPEKLQHIVQERTRRAEMFVP